MDERTNHPGSSSTAGTNANSASYSAEPSSSSRSVTGGNSSTPVLSMSMASVSSEESVEVFPLAEQEEIAALTHDVRIFIESLGKLGRTFNPVDRDKHEAMRVAAHDRLGDVLRILRTVLEKYPSLHSTELLMTAGTLIQRVKGYNYEDECLDSKDTLETIDQLALALSSRVSEYVMGDLDANFSLSSSVSSKTKSCENLDSDAESIQDVHIVDKKPDLLSPQEIDSMLLKLEQGVDFALNRAKLWAKYARDVMMYIERRTYLDLEYAKNLSKLAQTFGPSIIAEPNLPLQSIYCSLLENDAANSNANQATCNLVLGNKYLEPLSARRNEHEQSRKKAKELWHRKLTQMHSAISRIREARTSYQYCQLEWEKTREALLRSDPSDQKYEKKRLREDEALQRVGQTRFHLSQHFDAPKGMIFLSDRVKPGIGGGIFPGRKTNLSPGTFPRGESIEQPAWLAFDNQILTFDAYFQETAQERDGYNHNIRPCKIFFYPQDGTMLVTEPKTENSGMSQGTLLSRHRIPYPSPKDSEFYNILDLNIGREIEIYGRFFKIVNCDLFTRNYLNRCGIPVADPIDMPVDPYSKLRQQKEGKKYAKHPTHTVHKLRQFLRYDRQVLSFKAFWDDRRREGGFVHLLKVNYYLCDDTIEIFEIFAPGLSQESGSTFLGKCKLPKSFKELPGIGAARPTTLLNLMPMGFMEGRYIEDPINIGKDNTEYVGERDLTLGGALNVFGRKIVLTECDGFTAEYYRTKYGLSDFHPFERPKLDHEIEIPKVERTMPPWNGIGSHEDSACNCDTLEVKRPPGKTCEGLDSCILRFDARLLTRFEDDKLRTFVITYHMDTGFLDILENTAAETGFKPGFFLRHDKVPKPDQDLYSVETPEYYKAEDFYVGKVVEIHCFKFKIVDADEYTFRYMELNECLFTKSNMRIVLKKIRDALASCYKQFVADNWPTDPCKPLSYCDFRKSLILLLGDKITEHEIITVSRMYGIPYKPRKISREQLQVQVHGHLRKNFFDHFKSLETNFIRSDECETGYVTRDKMYSIIRGALPYLKSVMVNAMLDHICTNPCGELSYCDMMRFLNYRDCPTSPQMPFVEAQELNTFGLSPVYNRPQFVDVHNFVKELGMEKAVENESG